MSDRQSSASHTVASHKTSKQASWPGYYYDDRQLFDQLQSCSHSLSAVSQRISEKNMIINNLQDNFSRERYAMLNEISTLKWKLSIEEQKVKIAAQKQEISDGAEGEEVCGNGGAKTVKPEAGPEQAEERRSESLEAEHHKVQYQALQPKPQQRVQVRVLVPRRAERPVPQSAQAAETESWQSARETVSPSVEQGHGEGEGQAQVRRKRKRAVRGGDGS